MAMDANEIKAELVRRGITQTEIAEAVGRSKQLVGDVIRRQRRNPDIEREIAQRIGKPVRRVFEAA